MLLNVCCAPCGLPIIEALAGSELTLFFDGPNIAPRAEYDRRLAATRRVAELYQLKFLAGEYEHEAWLKFVAGQLEQPPAKYPENGERCRACFKFRLQRTAFFAREHGFTAFATTLSVSRFKDVVFINQYGKELANKLWLTYVPLELDPGLAHRRGRELSQQHEIYRQKYCGCEFSLQA
ncbi:MAG: epoxyqueuosine reductase QueH [Candidatus Margulisiibacteriota bacterium]